MKDCSLKYSNLEVIKYVYKPKILGEDFVGATDVLHEKPADKPVIEPNSDICNVEKEKVATNVLLSDEREEIVA